MTSKAVTVLGSSGSIGVSTLDVLSRHLERFHIFALTANSNVERLFEQCMQFRPRYAVMVEAAAAEVLARRLRTAGSETEVLAGSAALEAVASSPETDYVMAAIVGAAGLLPTLAAARAGKRVMLANKEALVMSGQLFIDTVREHGAELLPIDSEHNAVFQCMPLDGRNGVEKILLTASGGPFRTWSAADLQTVTPAQAVAHPNWSMGQKISVDSATLMNKGLEVIEACWLFSLPAERVEVVVHPQSTIHSMVSYNDGSVLAQLGNPDMRTPIAYALGWPERLASGVAPLDMFATARLDFERADIARFPCLSLAYEAHTLGGFATIALNAANEEAVKAFLQRDIAFTDIPRLVADVMCQAERGTPLNLADILVQDEESRIRSLSWIKNKKAYSS
ncbi:MAG TPA: 1-deoxy-D-xylulose-5-phosphate reductoisomerase [Candidatus Thiothrix moscowensis]|uniref:1-deoxy-D-xylulose-5-phosphate reductoisomerase n=1 Tax=unclassified Thiothrix TaxID=2636184 RepID=UPI0025E8C3A5|nr:MULTISPECIES: 1-deoxy-D-xylulose-5-phosphate reductoisomerase [unclassified Thiothrix]HRJ52800.1 1-deoxy-D-xylulose-5-phosphate reductoisomerase [Candidatus Thiothrix moscowensis]HRJ94431.1 1-deoxy-D-xylulose-5-phosphate reductoisomerase [Candidatus Thiothrix moscowensis]